MSVNITPGSPTANSYVSVASADSYMNARENSDSWLDISGGSTGTLSATTRKENLLRMATREIDNTYRYHESKYYNGIQGGGQDVYQSLEFPRSSNTDNDGNLIIPDEIKYATYEQALWVMERTGKRTTNEGVEVKKQVIGDYAENELKGWKNIQVRPMGKYSWAKLKF